MIHPPPSTAVSPSQLSQVDLFQNLTAAGLETIARSALPQTLAKEQPLFLQGDPADHIFLLLQGHIKLVQTHHNGHQIVIRIAQPLEMIAALALGQVSAYPASAYTMSPCKLAYWPKEVFLDHLQHIPILATNTMRFMAERIQFMQDRFVLIATQRVEQRLAHTLANLASTSGKATPSGIVLTAPLSRQVLSEMIGTTLYSVSRLLQQWEKQHIVQCGREKIVILNLTALEAIRDLDIPTKMSQ